VTTAGRRAIFTICSNNYIAYAKVLLNSCRRHHPESDLFVCVVDEPVQGEDFYPDCNLLFAKDLGISDFQSFAFQYTVMELNTAVKPFVFRHLFMQGYGHLIYFDPDIELFGTLEPVLNELNKGASFVLTPHLCSPSEGEVEPNDFTIMRAGIYNLGFLACGRHEETLRLISWWARRLQYDCRAEPHDGIFVDQKYMDLIPGFAARCSILRDTTCNVAYWNLGQRSLTESGNRWYVDGKALTFFHFSGFDPYNEDRLSKYTLLFQKDALDRSRPLRTIITHYRTQLFEAGYETSSGVEYAYDRFASGARINHLVRELFREEYSPWHQNPFESFERVLNLPAKEATGNTSRFVVTNLMYKLKTKNRGVDRYFNVEDERSVADFVYWFVAHGPQFGVDPRLIAPVAERASAKPCVSIRQRSEGTTSASERDVTVVGYLKATSGIGEVARQTLRSLNFTQLAAAGYDVSFGLIAPTSDENCELTLTDAISSPVQIFNINADQLKSVIQNIETDVTQRGYRISIPFWELAEFPNAWLDSFNLVDEVWAPSRFIQMALVRKIAIPVIYMPVALAFEADAHADRNSLGLPDHTFLFFFSFDFLSYSERKNPLGTFRAFQKAFPIRNKERVGLVIKTLNGNISSGALADLRKEIASDPRVILVDGNFPRATTLSLIKSCDCIVSLHRSEGLGLLIGEALGLGKPVIATDYSATTEFITPKTGYPINYRLIPVEEGQYPYADGFWADPDENHAAWTMRHIYNFPGEALRRAAAGQQLIANQFSYSHIGRLQRQRLAELGLRANERSYA
jgi:glycosyltransferase involved in cell wall biosynthesis